MPTILRDRVLATDLGKALVLARSGMVDLDFYAAQCNVRFSSATAAARHYLASGAHQGLSLHPLFEPAHLRAQRPNEPGDPAIRYLTEPEYAALQPHPLFDLKRARRAVGKAAARGRGGAWLAWITTVDDSSPVPLTVDGAKPRWGDLRPRMIAAAQRWRMAASGEELAPELQPDGKSGAVIAIDLSVILPVADDINEALGRRRLLDASDSAVELVFSGCRSRGTYVALSALTTDRPVTVLAAPEASYAEAVNLGAAAARGSVLVIIAPGTTAEPTVVHELALQLDDPSVAICQPLEENPDMSVLGAGAYFAPGDVVPTRLLTGHAAADADRMGDRALPSIFAGTYAMRRVDFEALGGLRSGFGDAFGEVDLSLRAADAGLGTSMVVTQTRVTVHNPPAGFASGIPASAALLRRTHTTVPSGSAEALAAAGFLAIDHTKASAPATDGAFETPDLGSRTCRSADLPPSVPVLRPTRSLNGDRPTLRWAIDIAATPGRWGESWGDRHFANSLAAALRRLGQQVAVDHRGANQRPSRAHDDVILTLRGLYPVAATPGKINLLWVISHPDEVTSTEIDGYQHVFAASPSWAEARAAQWGVRVDPLLQCTDVERFHPGRAEPDSGPAVVFIGNTRHVERPVIDYALRAGAVLTLYGTGWEGTPAADRVVATSIANTEIGPLYASAGVVLNDHWGDMKAQGFISNRLFDAVACGARVLSDAVDGASQVFGESVQYYHDADDVARLLADPERNWPGLDARRAAAKTIANEHSFDRRAAQLLTAAIAVLRGDGGSKP